MIGKKVARCVPASLLAMQGAASHRIERSNALAYTTLVRRRAVSCVAEERSGKALRYLFEAASLTLPSNHVSQRNQSMTVYVYFSNASA